MTALLLGLAAGIAGRGPIRFERPATIFSNTPDPVPPFFSDAYLSFLEALRAALPEGGDVAVLTSDPSPMSLGYFVALSQLPRQRLETPSRLSASPPPRFVAAFRREFPDPRYALRRALPDGALYERR